MCNAMNIMGFLMHFKAPLLMACRDCSASAQLRNVAAISFYRAEKSCKPTIYDPIDM